MAWIGTLGNLVEFKCPAQLRRAADIVTTVRTTLGGVDKAFVEPVGPARTWDVGLSAASPDDLAVLGMLTAGVYGRGPFWFVDPWAERTNLLSPRAAMPGYGNEFAYSTSTGTAGAASIPPLGPVPAVTAAAATYLWFAYGTPVVPGKPVTVSAYVRGSGAGELMAVFLDATGATIATQAATYTTPGNWQRKHVTAPATPAGAVQVRIRITSSSGYAAALPAVTWMDRLTPYAPGQGAPRVILTGADLDVVRAADTQQLAAQGVTLRELRSANA